MSGPLSTLHQTAQAQAARAAAQADNQPRPSRIHFTIKVSGVGETRLIGAKALKFGTMMLEEPSFSFGVIAVGSIAGGYMPLATAMVLSWVKDKNSHLYTGAELGFKVQSAQSGIVVRFSLTFEASALRTTAGTVKPLGVNGKLNAYTGTI